MLLRTVRALDPNQSVLAAENLIKKPVQRMGLALVLSKAVPWLRSAFRFPNSLFT